ncbi:MAG: hypothetical protein ACK40O_04160 [Allosphingosinicella sp.]
MRDGRGASNLLLLLILLLVAAGFFWWAMKTDTGEPHPDTLPFPDEIEAPPPGLARTDGINSSEP